MGISYIICGAPDYVECQGLTSEVWDATWGGTALFLYHFGKAPTAIMNGIMRLFLSR